MNSKSPKEALALCRGPISSLCSYILLKIDPYLKYFSSVHNLQGTINWVSSYLSRDGRGTGTGKFELPDLFARENSTFQICNWLLYLTIVSVCAITWLPADLRSGLQFQLGAGGRQFGHPGQPAPPAETWCLSASRGPRRLGIVTKFWASVGHNKSTLFQAHRAVKLIEHPPGDHRILQAKFLGRARSKYVAASSAFAIGCLNSVNVEGILQLTTFGNNIEFGTRQGKFHALSGFANSCLQDRREEGFLWCLSVGGVWGGTGLRSTALKDGKS